MLEDDVQPFGFRRRLEILVAVIDGALGARRLASPALHRQPAVANARASCAQTS